MFDRNAISELYENVLDWEVGINRIQTGRMKSAIQSMNRVYSPDTTDFDSTFPKMADFNDVAFRCAYLHKYAPLHTYIVFDVMLKVLRQERTLFQKLVNSERFKMCCLGGGPGSDIFGALAALYAEFGNFKSSATVIDCMEKWKYTFASIIYQLRIGGCGKAWTNFAENFEWRYVGANLLHGMTNEVNASIASACLVTMIKFLSAAACKRTEYMIKVILKLMKPGALLLFIDNAGGGFTQLMMKSVQENGFVTLFGPLQHVRYSEEAFKSNRFGYNSCFSTTVTIFLLQKPLNIQVKRKYTPLSQNNSIVNERTPLLYSETKMKKASSLKYFPEDQVGRKSSAVLLPDSEDSKIDNSKLLLTYPLQFSQTLPRNNITVLPEKGNMKKSSRSPKSVNAKNVQTERTPKPTAYQPLGPTEQPILHVRVDKTFQKTEFKAGPCISQQRCITNHTSITVQQISVETNYNAGDCFQRNVTPRNINYSKTCSEESKFQKLLIQENRSNATFQGVNSRTPLFPAQKENKAFHQNGFQKVKISLNPSNAITPVITNIRSETFAKNDVKVCALQKERLYDYSSVTSQSTSIAGTSYNISNCSESNTTRNNIDSSEAYSPNFHSTIPLKLPVKENKLNAKFQGVDSRTPLFPTQMENQDHFQSMITVPTHSHPSIDDDSPFKTLYETDGKGRITQKKLIPNYSSINTQPDSVAKINYSADVNRRSKPTKTQKNIEVEICCPCVEVEVCCPYAEEEVCCPCCVTS